MTSNLLIVYPHIQWDAIIRDTTPTFDEFFPEGNLYSGHRYQRGKVTAGGSGAFSLELDLGSGASSSASCLVLARADRLLAQGCTTVEVLRNSAGIGSAYTSEFSQTITDMTTGGPQAADRIYTFTETSAYRAWKVAFSGGSATARSFSKMYLGNPLDVGQHPSAFSWKRVSPSVRGAELSSGAFQRMRTADPFYRFTLSWEKVTDAIRSTWESRIERYADAHRYFLYTVDQHQILNNRRIAHVKLVDCEARATKGIGNYNTIDATFEEVAG
jgi:hypothetical protein